MSSDQFDIERLKKQAQASYDLAMVEIAKREKIKESLPAEVLQRRNCGVSERWRCIL